MKIIEITVRFQVGSREEQDKLLECIGVKGGVEDRPSDKGVKEEGPVAPAAYTPSCERTRLAYEALGKCLRIKLARPELIEKWAVAFPDVDLAAFLHSLDSWAETNNVTRGTKGWARSCNSNLSRKQDETRKGVHVSIVPAKAAAPVVVESETEAWLKAAA